MFLPKSISVQTHWCVVALFSSPFMLALAAWWVYTIGERRAGDALEASKAAIMLSEPAAIAGIAEIGAKYVLSTVKTVLLIDFILDNRLKVMFWWPVKQEKKEWS
jgi:hypothetical protein